MLDTQFFQMLVLFFKIFFYSTDMDDVTIDLIDDNQYSMSFLYNQGEYTLEVTPIIDFTKQPQESFFVHTIDNALYNVDLGEGTEFTLDLAPQFSSMDWEHLTDWNMEIPAADGGVYHLYQGGENIYLSDDYGKMLVLSRNS